MRKYANIPDVIEKEKGFTFNKVATSDKYLTIAWDSEIRENSTGL